MIWRYGQWTPYSGTDEDRLEQLVRLFNYVVMNTAGDVQQALDILKQIAERYGIFTDGMTLEELVKKLKEMGLIEEVNGVSQLTPRGIRKIRQDALEQVFSSLKRKTEGDHFTPYVGKGADRSGESREYAFGDHASDLDLTSTFSNAFRRGGIEEFSLEEEDLRIYDTELTSKCATVLMIDVSHSMVLYGEDRITPAKQVALALAELIQTRFPKDFLACVTFGDDAQLVSLAEVPFLQVGPFHTNTRAGLQMARHLLRRQGNVNKQIFMVTDGKPSAIYDDYGRLYKNPFGLDPRVINKTLDEAVQCRREKIAITTFMIARDPMLVNFVEEFTRANQGRAYYSSLDRLGEFILVDYLRNRKKRS